MALLELLKEKNISVYQCAKQSQIPYTTLLEVVKGKTRLEKCTAETVYKLAKVLGVSIEELLERNCDFMYKRVDFELFKSNVCHMVKDKGDICFIVETIESDEIRALWERQWYRESFYMLGMLDYLSRENELPICMDYEDIRNHSLEEPLYPKDIEMTALISPELDIKEKCKKEAIPEFMRFNIVEKEVRDVC